MGLLNETHEASIESWVASANSAGNDFPLQNLPFGIARRIGGDEQFYVAVAIGKCIVDLPKAVEAGMLSKENGVEKAVAAPHLNELIEKGPAVWSAIRRQLHEGLRVGSRYQDKAQDILVPMDQAEMTMPLRVSSYTDFFTSFEHATNAGTIFGREVPVTPNFYHIPIAYNGRNSSVRVSGTPCRRPNGMRIDTGDNIPIFGPSRQLDYELELGIIIGQNNELGQRVPYEEVEDSIFGVCLLNDWSSRDIQKFEAQPLGPFLGKSFLTSLSPWVVTLEALAPFRVPVRERETDHPAIPSHLYSEKLAKTGGLDIGLSVSISSERMRTSGMTPHELSKGNAKWLYWNIFQMMAHHTSNGCNLSVGDIFGTGTISGTDQTSVGCMLEMTRLGETPVTLPSGEERIFLHDGDEVIFRGCCSRDGVNPIGFGECRGTVYSDSCL